MCNHLNKAHSSLLVILLLPSFCSAAAPSMPFIEIVYVIVALYYIFAILVVAIFIAMQVKFLISLSKVLEKCDEHATMPSNFVWFNLIPIFNFGWMIYTVVKVSESIEKKLEASGAQVPSKGAKVTGLVYSISLAIAPFVGFSAIVALISWIIYWAKVNGYNKSIPVLQEGDH